MVTKLNASADNLVILYFHQSNSQENSKRVFLNDARLRRRILLTLIVSGLMEFNVNIFYHILNSVLVYGCENLKNERV